MTGNNNLQIGTKELGAIADEDEDNPDEYIGFIKFSTTGEALVPQDWLLEQWESHGLPQDLLPKKPSNWSAYRRMINYMEEHSDNLSYSVYNDHYGQSFDCTVDIKKSREEGTNVFVLKVDTFFPEDVIGEEGGDWKSQRLGYFDFNRPDEGEGYFIHKLEIDKDNAHWDYAEKICDEARGVWNKMKDHHNFSDINGILTKYRSQHAEAVEIRRACYFIPAHRQESLEALSAVWDGMNQFKERGEVMRIDKTPVVDMKEQRELIANRVREKLEDMVDNVVGEIIENFQDEEDQTADQAANELLEQLEDSKGISATYNELLNLRLSIKDILQERRKELEEESEEILENAISQTDLEEY
jgi:hypothetical protein